MRKAFPVIAVALLLLALGPLSPRAVRAADSEVKVLIVPPVPGKSESQLLAFFPAEELRRIAPALNLYVALQPADVAAYGRGTRFVSSGKHEFEMVFPKNKSPYLRFLLDRWNQTPEYEWSSQLSKNQEWVHTALIQGDDAQKFYEALGAQLQAGAAERRPINESEAELRILRSLDERLEIRAARGPKRPLPVRTPRSLTQGFSRYVVTVRLKLDGSQTQIRDEKGKTRNVAAKLDGGLDALLGMSTPQEPQNSPSLQAEPRTTEAGSSASEVPPLNPPQNTAPSTISPAAGAPAIPDAAGGGALSSPFRGRVSSGSSPRISADEAFAIWAQSQGIATNGASPDAAHARQLLEGMANSGALDALVDKYRRQLSGPGNPREIRSLDVRRALEADLRALMR